ncbi:SDR family NAD(P)-dependent oxidoreductase [Spirosoma sp. HMF3257]|uniref:SDR family NAD(P)-dependent oxidoreductase n=1 Tax=Spirosoma telluris TaxID=2183553 RepID=A0A327NMG0_9BACT|nr:SDR family NAD(P)-dependent oxidoreductase [Spirosoma telluris]RAI76621.1 SDR family NAD(P)-dependent oxidoreductase [Spirosoma telluris]
MSANSISIIGLGWLGLPLANQLLVEGFQVKGSTTSIEKKTLVEESGIDTYALQLVPEPVGDLASLLQADTLVINIPPKAGKLGEDFHPAQINYLAQAIRQSPIKHAIYVSSTSVYPELNRIVVEDDVVELHQSAAPGLTRAEQLIQGLAPDRLVTILRCGGLMGYDRIPGKYVAGRTVDSGAVPVNYLHRDDAIGILVSLIRQEISGTFNAVSPEHPTREAIYRKSCVDFGYELPTFVTPAKPVSYKVISPEKLINATNYQFRYADPLTFFYAL